MKAKLLHEMSIVELNNKLQELKSELFLLRFKHATGQLSNNMQLNTCKKDIARIKTILLQKQTATN